MNPLHISEIFIVIVRQSTPRGVYNLLLLSKNTYKIISDMVEYNHWRRHGFSIEYIFRYGSPQLLQYVPKKNHLYGSCVSYLQGNMDMYNAIHPSVKTKTLYSAFPNIQPYYQCYSVLYIIWYNNICEYLDIYSVLAYACICKNAYDIARASTNYKIMQIVHYICVKYGNEYIYRSPSVDKIKLSMGYDDTNIYTAYYNMARCDEIDAYFKMSKYLRITRHDIITRAINFGGYDMINYIFLECADDVAQCGIETILRFINANRCICEKLLRDTIYKLICIFNAHDLLKASIIHRYHNILLYSLNCIYGESVDLNTHIVCKILEHSKSGKPISEIMEYINTMYQ